MHMCDVIPAGEEKACPQCQHTPTCISQKAVTVILDDSGPGVVEAIATIIAANGDFSRWVHVGELRDTLRRHKGQVVYHQGHVHPQLLFICPWDQRLLLQGQEQSHQEQGPGSN